MDITRIWNNEKQLKALTGMEKEEIDSVIPLFEQELIGYEQKEVGRPSTLCVNGIFLMLMMYYRHYNCLEALGALFNLNVSNVKRWIDRSEKALHSSLEKKSLLHLIQKPKEKSSQKPWRERNPSILMELNSQFGVQQIK